MILVPYPNKDAPEFLINVESIEKVGIRKIRGSNYQIGYAVIIYTHNEYGFQTVSDNHETKEDALSALKDFYIWLTDVLNQ